MSARSCTVIVKVTRLCNLRCSYCHDWRSGPGQTMSFPVLARVIAAALRDPTHDSVSFVWHGGEPSVLPVSYLRKAMVVQARYARPGQHVRNVLQTNGVAIDGKWAEFLREAGFEVGISLDGPPHLHDRHRVDRAGRGTSAAALRGLRTLRAGGVRAGVLMVVDQDTLEFGPRRIFDFFLEHEIVAYGFNAACPDNTVRTAPAAPVTAVEHYVTPAQMASFLGGIYDCWLAHGDRAIRIRELDALRARVNGEAAMTCQLRGDCLGEYFIVEPDGQVAHCDLFMGDPAYELGRLAPHAANSNGARSSQNGAVGFAALRHGAALTRLRANRAMELAAMSACPEFDVCNGWCPHETYLSRRHDPAHRDGCCGLRPLIEHIRAHPGGPARPGPVPLETPSLRTGS